MVGSEDSRWYIEFHCHSCQQLTFLDHREPLEDRGVFDHLRIPGDLSVSIPFQEVDQAQGGMFEQIGWMSNEVGAATQVVTDGGDRSLSTGSTLNVEFRR